MTASDLRFFGVNNSPRTPFSLMFETVSSLDASHWDIRIAPKMRLDRCASAKSSPPQSRRFTIRRTNGLRSRIRRLGIFRLFRRKSILESEYAETFRHSRAPCQQAAFRSAPRDRRRTEILGRAEGAVARSGRQTPRRRGARPRS